PASRLEASAGESAGPSGLPKSSTWVAVTICKIASPSVGADCDWEGSVKATCADAGAKGPPLPLRLPTGATLRAISPGGPSTVAVGKDVAFAETAAPTLLAAVPDDPLATTVVDVGTDTVAGAADDGAADAGA